ncbi:MAG TPA: hypothetical protein PLJ21_04990, partial [Pseudobdellovibrionaceae bacterium]|nr:hypothetical protein [Pseudobdellovibrionaceae bacterium]
MKKAVRRSILLSYLFLMSIGCSKESLQIVSSRSSSSTTSPEKGNPTLSPPTDFFLFSVKDFFSTSNPNSAYAYIIATEKNSKNELFVIGSSDGGGSYGWELRKSKDLGQSWTVILNKDMSSNSKFMIDDQDHIFLWDRYSMAKILKSENTGSSWYEIPLDLSNLSSCSSFSNIGFLSSNISSVRNYILTGSCYSSLTYQNTWFLMRSVDGGVTWFRDDPLVLSNPLLGYDLSPAIYINGYIYLFGAESSGPYQKWTVARKNLISNSPWEVFSKDIGVSSTVKDLVININNDLYVGIQYWSPSSHIKVYKFSNGGDFLNDTNWIIQSELSTDVDNYFGFSSYYSLNKLLAVGTDIYLTGNASTPSGLNRWFVVRNDGSVGTNVNSFGEGNNNFLHSALLLNSKLYMFGQTNDAINNNHWMTRSLDISNSAVDLSTNAGISEIYEDYLKFTLSNANRLAQINALTPSGSSKLYASGFVLDGSSKKQWFVRTSSNLGESWKNELVSTNAYDSEILSSVVLSNGDFYVAGYELTASAIKKAVIKKRQGSDSAPTYTDVNFAANPTVNSFISSMTN